MELENHLLKSLHSKRETFVEDGDKFHIKRSINVEPMIEGVKMMGELDRPERDNSGRLYLGSIDTLTAINWAKECGAKIYYKEWRDYAIKKIRSPEFSKFRVDRKRKYG